jgi:hypothetical protein
MRLKGYNTAAKSIKHKQQDAYERYFLPWVNTDNSNNGKIAHRYESITYQNIYPNIDWKLYYTPSGALEYDFVIHPGGNINDIQLSYEGADSLRLTPDGSLVIYTPQGSIKEHAPIAHDDRGNKVATHFVLQHNTITFATAPYNGTLTIDPIIEWATYFGGPVHDRSAAITHDNSGNIYTIGNTNSTTNIATTGAYQQVFGGGNNASGSDGIIAKWSDIGTLQWCSYYGGTNIDILYDVVIDNSGNINVVGKTNSTAGIATTNAHQDTLNGIQFDLFLLQFDSTGSRNWCTYFGGTSIDGSDFASIDIDTLPLLSGKN